MWLACRLIGALFRDSAIFVLDVLFTVTCSQTLYFLFKVRRAGDRIQTAGDLLTASASG